MQNLKYFTWSIGFTVFGLVGGYLIGGWPAAFIVAVLAVLNLAVLRQCGGQQPPPCCATWTKWRQRFLL